MTFNTDKAIREGIQRTFTRNGFTLIGVVILITVIDVIADVVVNILRQDSRIVTVESFTSSGFPLTTYSFSGFGGQIASEGTTVDLTVQFGVFSITPDLVFSLVMTVIWAAFWVIATRIFVSDHTDTIPREFIRHNIGFAAVNVVVGSIVVSILVSIGLVLFIIPGIIISIGMLFVGHEIAVRDENIIGAIRNSWWLMKRFIIQILILGFVLGLLFLMGPGWVLLSLFGSVFSALATLPLWLAGLLLVLMNAVIMVCGIAIAARAYAQFSRSYIRKNWELSAAPGTASD